MAIITGKRKNILDINEDVTIGVGFPLNEINLFKGTKTTHEQTKANLLNLVMTCIIRLLVIPLRLKSSYYDYDACSEHVHHDSSYYY